MSFNHYSCIKSSIIPYFSVRIKMPALIGGQITGRIQPCSESSSELVVEQEAEATVKKATVPRDVRLSLFKSQCEDLINYLQTSECRPGLSKKEIRNIKNKAATHKLVSYAACSRVRGFLPTHRLLTAETHSIPIV